MLHVFADSFEGVNSGYLRLPISELLNTDSGGSEVSGLDQIRANALSSSALASEGLAGRSLLHNDMGIRAVDDTNVVTRSIVVDQADSFRFPHSAVSNGIVRLPPTAQVTPTQDDEVTFLAGVTAGNLVAPTSLAAWNGDNPATYKTETSESKWGTNVAGTAGGNVTYFFDAGSAWTATEQAVFVAAYALWADLANITFSLAASQATANIVIVRPGSGGAHFDGQLTSGEATPGQVGQNKLWSFAATGSTLNIQTSASSFGPITADPNEFGGHVWGTVVHESGHSLGLGHGGPYNGAVVPLTQQFSAQDTTLWTIMSYIDPKVATAKYFAEYPVLNTDWGQQPIGGGPSVADRSPTTAMMLDILAAQRLYGAPVTTAYNGGQIYGFNCNIADASKPFYDFTVNTHPVVTIWNAGTGNTLDLSGFTTSSNVNLNPGTFSSSNGMVNNIGIAFSTTINTFVGGSGDDTVLANPNGDLISSGSGGNENFTGGIGNDGFSFGATYTIADRVNGGAGTNDQVALQGTYAGVTIGGTQFQNVEVLVLKPGFNYGLTLQNDLMTGGTFTVWWVTVAATHSATIDSSGETDTAMRYFAGQGNDSITGGAAGNLFYGEGGQDTLLGGTGADTFAYLGVSDSTSTGGDLIRQFTTANDRIDLPTGTNVAAIDAKVNGGTLTLAAFDADLAAAVGAGQLAIGHAVLFQPTAGGDFGAGTVFLIVDANGQAGYQASADYVFNVSGNDLSALGTANFI